MMLRGNVARFDERGKRLFNVNGVAALDNPGIPVVSVDDSPVLRVVFRPIEPREAIESCVVSRALPRGVFNVHRSKSHSCILPVLYPTFGELWCNSFRPFTEIPKTVGDCLPFAPERVACGQSKHRSEIAPVIRPVEAKSALFRNPFHVAHDKVTGAFRFAVR